jgi:hypothetical protein
MKTNSMLVVMDREAQLLTDDNWHAAAVIMAQAAERIRLLADRLRAAGLSAEIDAGGA